MKRIGMIFMAAGIGLACCKAQGYTVKGHVANLPDGWVYLAMVNNGLQNIDSMISKEGYFFFAGTQVVNPGKRYIRAKGKFSPLAEFYLEPGKINLDGTLYHDITLTGTPLNVAFAEYRKTVYASRNSAANAYHRFAMAANDSSAARPLKQQYDSLKKVLQNNNLAFLKKYNTSIVAVDALKEATAEMDARELEQALQLLDSSLLNKPEVIVIRNRIVNIRKTETGKMAPAFTLPGADSQLVSLEQFKGKFVLVDFWASWCMPCRGENPNLVKAYQKFNNRNFEIVGISLDRSKTAWLNAVRKDELPWTNLVDAKAASTGAYGIETIPYNVLVDPSGKIIATALRGKALEEKLDALLPYATAVKTTTPLPQASQPAQ